MDKGYYKKSQYVHLWLHLLLKANHIKAEFMWNGKIIIIKEGQLLTGRKELSIDTGITEGTIENILKMLENEHQILQQKTTKFRIITILNWCEYQSIDNKIDSKVTTELQQTDTNKNNKNEENDKNDIYMLWIKTFGRNPKIPEVEETGKLIQRFGYDKVYQIFKSGTLEGFHKLKTLIDSLDENGNIKPKGNKDGLYSKHITEDKLKRIATDIANDPDLKR
jgi:hypothetical protein